VEQCDNVIVYLDICRSQMYTKQLELGCLVWYYPVLLSKECEAGWTSASVFASWTGTCSGQATNTWCLNATSSNLIALDNLS
jgi:hypothetical protein